MIEEGIRADGQPNHKDALAYMRRRGVKMPRRLYLLAGAGIVWSKAPAAVRQGVSRALGAASRLKQAW